MEQGTERDIAEEPFDSVRTTIGRRLAELREDRGMSVRGLADAAGVSGSLVSQVENGHVTPSVATLVRIASALGAKVGDFFEPSLSDGEVMQPGDRAVYTYEEHGVIDEVLSSDPKGEIELLRSIIKPGGGTGNDETFVHDTRVEVVYVIRGEIELGIGERRITLQAGDSITFPGDQPHGAWNHSNDSAELIWAATPARY